jgi:hypothetical protein
MPMIEVVKWKKYDEEFDGEIGINDPGLFKEVESVGYKMEETPAELKIAMTLVQNKFQHIIPIPKHWILSRKSIDPVSLP